MYSSIIKAEWQNVLFVANGVTRQGSPAVAREDALQPTLFLLQY